MPTQQRTRVCPTPPHWQKLPHHPLACLVGFGEGIDLDQLIASVRDAGYDALEPVVLYEKKILDGRHRHHACVQLDQAPNFVEFTGTPEQARAFVLKKIHRQHLTDKERAEIAARLATAGAGNQPGAPTPPIGGVGMTVPQAAKALKVSRRSVERAKAAEKDLRDYLDSRGDAYGLPVCEACRRGKRRDCPECKKLLAAEVKKWKKAKARPRRAPSTNGKPLLDARAWHNAFGVLVRSVDQLMEHYGGADNSPTAAALKKNLTAFRLGFAELHRERVGEDFPDATGGRAPHAKAY